MNASILPFVRRSFLLAPPMAIQLMSLAGSSPTLAAMILSKNSRGARVRRGADAYGLALQIDDAADQFAGEQLETGRMHPGQHERGNAGVDLWDRGGGVVLDEVRVSARDLSAPMSESAPGT